MNRFERKRMGALLGENHKAHAYKNTLTRPPVNSTVLTNHNHNLPPSKSTPSNNSIVHQTQNKAVLFRDYSYMEMELRKNNQLERWTFPCFKDDLCFDQPPITRILLLDNDNESDDEQVRRERKKMAGFIRQAIEENKKRQN